MVETGGGRASNSGHYCLATGALQAGSVFKQSSTSAPGPIRRDASLLGLTACLNCQLRHADMTAQRSGTCPLQACAPCWLMEGCQAKPDLAHSLLLKGTWTASNTDGLLCRLFWKPFTAHGPCPAMLPQRTIAKQRCYAKQDIPAQPCADLCPCLSVRAAQR